MWTKLVLVILTSKPVRLLAAKIIEGGVRSTKTTLDDIVAKPVLDYLRS